MQRSRPLRLVQLLRLLVVAPVVLLVACGGDDDAATGDAPIDSVADVPVATDAPVDADAPVATDAAVGDGGDTTAPDAGQAPMGLMVLDALTLTFDAPAPVAGSISRSGLAAADPLSLDVRCMRLGSYLEVGYTAATPGEMPVEFFVLTTDGVDGPGTYDATITLSAPEAPAGTMPFTEVTGQPAELTVTGDLAGSFRVDDGFGNDITGSYTCTEAPMP